MHILHIVTYQKGEESVYFAYDKRVCVHADYAYQSDSVILHIVYILHMLHIVPMGHGWYQTYLPSYYAYFADFDAELFKTHT